MIEYQLLTSQALVGVVGSLSIGSPTSESRKFVGGANALFHRTTPTKGVGVQPAHLVTNKQERWDNRKLDDLWEFILMKAGVWACASGHQQAR
ncbi:MAG: hypothetical protein O2951_18250 [Bacteroidetes bacterium]|nr:hypothetical protein [Bacteroidota bacterium]